MNYSLAAMSPDDGAFSHVGRDICYIAHPTSQWNDNFLENPVKIKDVGPELEDKTLETF